MANSEVDSIDVLSVCKGGYDCAQLGSKVIDRIGEISVPRRMKLLTNSMII